MVIRSVIFQFDNIQLDTDNFSVLDNGVPRSVEPKVFDLLVYLITHKDRVVTRQELFDQIWSDRVVTDATLSNHINTARKLTGDDGEQQKVIKTVHGRGYQFVAKLKSTPGGGMPKAESHSRIRPLYLIVLVLLVLAVLFLLISQPEGPLPEGEVPQSKSIAVMPFINHSNLAGDRFFTDGIHDDLLTRISKIGTIRTISRNSVKAYRESGADARTIGKELGVTTILEGGVQRAENEG